LTSLLDYLEHTSQRYPEKTAFADENESITFAQLKELGQRLGTHIYRQTGQTRLPVAVHTNHLVSDVAAFIGTLYAGCFYVPLDGNAPVTHLDAQKRIIGPAAVIDSKSCKELPSAAPDHTVLQKIRRTVRSSDPAYAIFTSGSTGTPKAALISHGSVINLTEWICSEFGFSEKTVFAGQCPFYFDSSVQELYSTIKAGATTHLLPRKYFISPLKVLQMVDDAGANVMPWSAAAIKLVANSKAFEKHIPGGVTDVIFGGENMPGKILNIWRKAMPNVRFSNVYGPAETTVDCSFHTITRDIADDESVPIGRPIRDTELLLLGQDMEPVPDGESGEIYVRGAGVSLGYYKDAGRTAEAFVQNPFSPYRDIMYRTGDIARLNSFGELVFLARADSQVKHMGSRVELGEVETVCASIEGVLLACCAYDREKSKIILFYEGEVSEKSLGAELSTRLPRYMNPNIIIKVEKMPSMPNGKIDRISVRRVFYDDSK